MRLLRDWRSFEESLIKTRKKSSKDAGMTEVATASAVCVALAPLTEKGDQSGHVRFKYCAIRCLIAQYHMNDTACRLAGRPSGSLEVSRHNALHGP